MTSRYYATLAAAGFVGTALLLALPVQAAKAPDQVTVQGQRVDPALQRKVSYADLDLVQPRDQRQLRGRISRTAFDLCEDLNGRDNLRVISSCYGTAIGSTRDQVSAAILRAQRISMGLPVGPPVAISMVVAGS